MKKLLAITLSLLLSFSCLTGCADTSLKETDQLNIYNLINAKSSYGSGFYELIMHSYQSKYPDVASDYRTSDIDDYSLAYGQNITPELGAQLQENYDSISTSIMKGDSEDIIYADTFYQWFSDVTPPDYNKMIRSGAFLDMKPILEQIAPELDLSLFDSLLIDGKLYAVPVFRQPYVLYSAENMLQRWGFDFDPNEDILTFLRNCAAWKEEHSEDENAPVVFTRQAWEYIYYNLFNIMGVDAVDYESGTASFDDPQILEAFELLQALQSDLTEPICQDLYEVENQTLIYDRALFGITGGAYDNAVMSTRIGSGVNYLNDPIVIMPLLQLDGKIATASNTYLMIPANAKNKLNAARYVALVLESIKSRQSLELVIPTPLNFNSLYCWDAGEAALAECMAKTRPLLVSAEGVEELVWDLYRNQGDVKMPSYWFHSLKYLFDDYMAWEISIDTLASDVQSRLEIYVTE